MHAVGFFHEQNRYDRDGYVTINWDNIQSGKESNFNKVSDKETDAYGVTYDYGSVMHYSAKAFSKNDKATISPKVLSSVFTYEAYSHCKILRSISMKNQSWDAGLYAKPTN